MNYPAGEREDDEGDPEQDGVDAEVAAEPAADPGDHPVGPAPPEEAGPLRPRRRRLLRGPRRVFVHGWLL